MSAVAHDEELAELEAFVEREVARGRYRTRDDAIAEAFRLLRKHEQTLANLRAEIQVGLDQSQCGEGTIIDGDEAATAYFDRLRTEALTGTVDPS